MALAVWLALVSTAAAQTWTHEASGMQFPDQVGDFARVSIQHYDRQGLDVSAGYDQRRGSAGIAVTVYVFPPSAAGTAGCEQAYVGARDEISRAHGGGAPIREDEPPPVKGAAVDRHARFAYADHFAGRDMKLASDLLFYCPVGGKWIVQYRATWPEGDVGAEQAYDALCAALPWTITGQK